MTPIRTRFAPSPTGFLHLGHAYAAKVAHDLAARGGGAALLRLEDLDTGRARAHYETAIHDDLAWLGLRFAEPLPRQSGRLSVFATAVDRLTGRGLTYPCFCTRADLQAHTAHLAAPHGGEEAPFGPAYPGTCRQLDSAARARRLATGVPHALRLDMAAAWNAAEAEKRPLNFFEGFHGPPAWRAADPRAGGDIVLARKDVGASYHIAVVIDDASQGITHVTRGADLFASTHIHVLLQRLLGLPTPFYGHHALIRDEAGQRLAKRADAASIRSLKEAGKTPQEVLALLPPLPDFTVFDGLTSR